MILLLLVSVDSAFPVLVLTLVSYSRCVSVELLPGRLRCPILMMPTMLLFVVVVVVLLRVYGIGVAPGG